MGGLKSLKYVHNFTGLWFTVSLYFTIRMWWKEAGIFSMPEDLEWIRTDGGYLWHKKMEEHGTLVVYGEEKKSAEGHH